MDKANTVCPQSKFYPEKRGDITIVDFKEAIYDPAGDVLYLNITDANDNPVGIEFSCVRQGIDFTGLPV